MRLDERIEAGLRAGNLAWWEMELPSGKVAFDDKKAEMLGYSPESFATYEDFTRLLHPEDLKPAMAAMRDHIGGKVDRYEVEYRIKNSSGSYLWFRDIGAITERNDEAGTIRVIGIVENITQRKHAELELKAALEKEKRLMRELNHRIKNNLHMVSSLVSLKQEAVGNSVDLSDIRERIETIALIHDSFHQSGEIDTIDIGRYLRALLDRVLSLYSKKHVEVIERIVTASFPTETAVTLGLLVNELALNAMKHGFTPAEPPRFSVALEVDPKRDDYVLTVSNTGNEFPKDVSLENPQTLGLQIITSLVGQLRGTIEVERKPHPRFTVRFPVHD
jgi:PAS domain S-box-containing protein